MRDHFRKSLFWILLLVLGLFLEKRKEDFSAWISQLLPNTAIGVLLNYWKAGPLTTSASVFAFLGGILVGYTTGLLASAAHLRASEIGEKASIPAKATETFVNKSYTLLYLVPFVLTVILFQALFANWDKSIRAMCLVLVAGTALGGYQVFLNLYKSSESAPAVNRVLVDAVFPRQFRRKGIGRLAHVPGIKSIVPLLSAALRMRDCSIHSHCEALERAWHLSIVSVMILESLISGFYENFFPSPGQFSTWISGLGGVVLPSGSPAGMKTVVGCIWIVLAVDWIGVEMIRLICTKKWLKYYEKN